jgi:hypothetical protein
MQHDRPGTDEATRLDRAALEVGDVADDAVGADHGGQLGRGVDDRAVLHAGAGPDLDVAVVATQDGAGPDRRALADRDVADDGRVGVDVRLGVDVGDPVPERVDGQDYSAVVSPIGQETPVPPSPQ